MGSETMRKDEKWIIISVLIIIAAVEEEKGTLILTVHNLFHN
jgi:hypothetical protein